MFTTLLMKTSGSPGRAAAGKALREAGVGVVEVEDWNQVADELLKCEAAVVVCDADLDSAGAMRLTRALAGLSNQNEIASPAIAPEAARALSHDMRTPLSAMAGWVHLIESGKLDEAGLKRAASKLRGNIDDQVRMIERYLGANTQEGRQ
jgi:signal transduction histidine kinase